MFIKKIRRFAKTTLLLVLLLSTVLLFFHQLVQKPSVQDSLIRRLSDFTGYDIKTRKIELSLWRGIGLLVHGLEARSRRGPEGIKASSMRVVLDVAHLFRGRIMPTGIYLIRPVVDLGPNYGKTISSQDKEGFLPGLPVFWIPGLAVVAMTDGEVNLKRGSVRLHDLFGEARLDGSDSGMQILLNCRGNVEFKDDRSPFRISGHVLVDSEAKGRPAVNLSLHAEKIPLAWIPWPDTVPVEKGDFQTDLKIEGNLSEPLSVGGRIIVTQPRFMVRHGAREKNYALSQVSMDFESRVDGRKLQVPSLHLTTDKISLDLSLGLDFHQVDNPYIDLAVCSTYADAATFKGLFPSSILPAWVETRLFPILLEGSACLKALSLKGRRTQFQHLERPENHSALDLRIDCRDFKVFGMGMALPFEKVAAEVLFEKGDFKISRLTARFGESTLRESDLFVIGATKDGPVFEVLLDGSFNLEGLMRQKNMDIIPPDIFHALERMDPLTGELECLASFRYESGWSLPRTKRGEFMFRDVTFRKQSLLLPLALKQAEFHINLNDQNRFRAIGTWGRSTFHAIGIFGGAEEAFPVQWANVSADMDMNEVLPLLSGKTPMPLVFSGPLPCQVAVTRETDHWSCQGKADLEGVTLETAGLFLDPPGKEDMVSFDLDFSGRDRIDLNRVQWSFGESAVEVSGSYNAVLQEWRPLKVSAPSLLLEDLGLRVSPKNAPATGSLSCAINMQVSNRDPLSTQVTGRIKGKDIALDLERLPSPVTQCDFTWQFSGERIFIPQWKMMLGKSPVLIQGDLLGWNGLSGQVSISSDFIDAADFLPTGKFSFSAEESPDMGDFLHNTDLRLKTAFTKGRWKRLDWGPLKAEVDIRGGNVHIERADIRLEHGHMDVSGYLDRQGRPELFLSGYVSLKKQPLDILLEGLEIKEEYLRQGDLTMNALLQVNGKEWGDLIPSLTGRADVLIEKGLIRDSHVFVKILDFLSLQKIFKTRPSELSKEGLYFESLNAATSLENGLLSTEDLVMESPVWDVVASGEVDLAQKTIDFDLGIRPLETIDMMVANIPILGHIVAGSEKSFLTYYFKAAGPWKSPEVEYVPFKNLGSGVAGVLKRLFFTPVRLFRDLSKVTNRPEGPDEKK